LRAFGASWEVGGGRGYLLHLKTTKGIKEGQGGKRKYPMERKKRKVKKNDYETQSKPLYGDIS